MYHIFHIQKNTLPTPRYFEKTGCQTLKILYTPIDAYFYYFQRKKGMFKECFFLYAPQHCHVGKLSYVTFTNPNLSVSFHYNTLELPNLSTIPHNIFLKNNKSPAPFGTGLPITSPYYLLLVRRFYAHRTTFNFRIFHCF